MRVVRVIVTGRVQGVAFRDFVQREARSRGLTGWVRNRRDGSVEAVFAGEAVSVAEMAAVCRRGPPAARVTDVAVAPVEPADAALPAGKFEVLPTA